MCKCMGRPQTSTTVPSPVIRQTPTAAGHDLQKKNGKLTDFNAHLIQNRLMFYMAKHSKNMKHLFKFTNSIQSVI